MVGYGMTDGSKITLILESDYNSFMEYHPVTRPKMMLQTLTLKTYHFWHYMLVRHLLMEKGTFKKETTNNQKTSYNHDILNKRRFDHRCIRGVHQREFRR